MTNPADAIKMLITYAVIIPLAIMVGYLLTDPLDYGTMFLFGVVAVVLFSYTSLGLIPLWQGLYEVDLMNFYVGSLLARAEAPGPGLMLAWHPWSICRGLGYLVLTYELTRLSFARLTGLNPGTAFSIRRRWAVGISFLLLDAVLKYLCLEPVRRILGECLGGVNSQ